MAPETTQTFSMIYERILSTLYLDNHGPRKLPLILIKSHHAPPYV